MLQIDGLAMLMDAVCDGMGATIQPGAAAARLAADAVTMVEIADAEACRHNLLVSVSDDELSPSALAARVVLAEQARALVVALRWPGASLHLS